MCMKKWIIFKQNENDVIKLSKKFNITYFLAVLLNIRGITSSEEIDSFLNLNTKFFNPMEFKDMDKAVERIIKAIDTFEKICVYGDYDADGVTSTVLLCSYLESKNANVMFYIPQRDMEGYGLNNNAIDLLKEQNVSLIITVDNGIVSIDEIDYAKKLGIDTVVTDHHQPRDILPNAVAVVDPYRKDCGSRFKNLAGVGVVFKLISALEGENLDLHNLIEMYSDLVSIGTIGDVVPLISENRFLVKKGINIINNVIRREGLRALIDESGLSGKKITANNLSFTVIPRINASGRMDSSIKAVKLLLSNNYEQSIFYAESLDEYNRQRKQIGQDILKDVYNILEKEPHRKYDRVIIIEGENWHQGIIGIVASKVTEKYGKPCIIISINGDEAKGSGRSIKGFSLYEAVCAGQQYLTRFGGHHMAVGLNMYSKDIDSFKIAVNEYAKTSMDELPYYSLDIDCEIGISDITVDLVREVSKLEPFGCGNPKPIFMLKNMKLCEIKPISDGKHLKILVKKDKNELYAMKFFTTKDQFIYDCGDVLDLAVTLEISEYMGIERVSTIIDDIKLSNVNYEKILTHKRLFERIKRKETDFKNYSVNIALDEIIPTRNDFIEVYNYIKLKKRVCTSIDLLSLRLNRFIDFIKIYIILDTLSELKLITKYEDGDIYNIEWNFTNTKVNLESASILKTLRE